MKENNIVIICGIICITLIICGVLFWPTLYRYDKTKRGDNQLIVRVNRLTGYTDILYESRWQPIIKNRFQSLPQKEQNKVEITGLFKDGQYEGWIYNGTSWTISKIRLYIEAKDNEGNIIWGKKYETSVTSGEFVYLGYISPFSKGSFTIKLMDSTIKDPFEDIRARAIRAIEEGKHKGKTQSKPISEPSLPKETQKSIPSPKTELNPSDYTTTPPAALTLQPDVKIEEIFGYK